MRVNICLFVVPIFVISMSLHAVQFSKAAIADSLEIATLYQDFLTPDERTKDIGLDNSFFYKANLRQKELDAYKKMMANFKKQLIAFKEHREQYQALITKGNEFHAACALGMGISVALTLPEMAYHAGQNVCSRPKCANGTPAFKIGNEQRCFASAIYGRCARYALNINSGATSESLLFEEGCHKDCLEELQGQWIPSEPATTFGEPECLWKFGGCFWPIMLLAGACMTAECLNLWVTMIKPALMQIAKLNQQIEELRLVDAPIKITFINKINQHAPPYFQTILKAAYTWSTPQGTQFIQDEVGLALQREMQKTWRSVLLDVLFWHGCRCL